MEDVKWHAPTKFPAFQRIPTYLCSYLASEWNDCSIFLKFASLPLGQWDLTFQSKLEQVDVDHMMNIDATMQGLFITRSLYGKHLTRQVSASKTFQPGNVVCSFYGTIVYKDISKLLKSMKTYENGIIGVTQQDYERYGRRLFIDGVQFRELPKDDVIHGKRYIRIVPAKFCVGRYRL